MNRTATLSRWISSGLDRPVDATCAPLAGLHLLDTLAAVVACRDLEASVVARRRIAGRRGDDATVLGTHLRADVVDAAFAGAMTAHAAEVNDFMPAVLVQPGPAVVATALAVGETVQASGPDLLAAVALGYEVAYRVPLALGDGLRARGLASHGVAPCFGAAAVASALLRLSPEQVADVLSLTAQRAAGSWQWLLDVDHVEKALVFGGLGAQVGVEAALLVQAGYRGVPDVLDRPGTWFTTTATSRDDLDVLVADLDRPLALPQTAYKRYPVGGPTQPAVQALLALAPSCPADDVERVVIEMPGRWEAFRDAAMPALNLPYLTAVVLRDGGLDVASSQDLVRMRTDPDVRALAARVEVRHDPEQEAPPGTPRTESARVTVTLRDGRRLERWVPHVVGFPSHPMPAADVEAKARTLVGPALGEDRAEELVRSCRPGSVPGAAALVALVAGD